MENEFVILTISDKGASGLRQDTSGAKARQLLCASGMAEAGYEIIPDDYDQIRYRMIHYADISKVPLIITTGGTGFAPRDVTPEATRAVIDREAPGLAEAMRQKSLTITPYAMISRAVSGIRKGTLIINLPGSEKAVAECLEVIMPILPHALELIADRAAECPTH